MYRMLAAFFLLPAMVAMAQDAPAPQQLKRMYDDALVQLRAAQDRKNELANENESLKSKVAELSKQLDSAKAQLAAAQAEVEQNADRTFVLRSRQAAWEAFIGRYPAIRARWDVFMEKAVPAVAGWSDPLLDPNWPISALQG